MEQNITNHLEIPNHLIQIPERIRTWLPDGSYIFTVVKNIEPLLKSINYFPEYTFHDGMHLTNVLRISSELISEETQKKLNGKSIEYLVGAVLLHDLGMFVSQDGLNELIFSEEKPADGCFPGAGTAEWVTEQEIQSMEEDHWNLGLESQTWKELWDSYYSRAKRYDDKKLFEIFGDHQPVEENIGSCVPKENTNRQRLLFGDFLRQYHHRLAYEIACQGFPGKNGPIDVFQNCDVSHTDREIIGLIAYSHGVSLRSMEQYVKKSPIDLEEMYPIYYLMSVLRLADCLDLLHTRAPLMVREKQEFHSPVSDREFDLNQSITGYKFNPEQKHYFFNGEPKCSTVFLHAQNTLKKIQEELDLCWAVLAEKYRYQYELSIHRIASNLLDEEKAASYNDKFLTKKAELKANHNLLKLMVKPLYGNNPAFAVRELLQNSIDACHERQTADQEKGKIEIYIDTEKREFRIADNGMGMSEDVLINHYLVAGSSYRHSDSWKEAFVNEDGSVKVCRVGRFGVGVLAAFLIGDKMEVITQYLKDKRAYYLALDINQDCVLDVWRVKGKTGTVIRIQMNDFAVKYFKNKFRQEEWLNWYHFGEPEIRICLDGAVLEREHIIDAENPRCGWHKTQDSCFDELLWSFQPKFLTKFGRPEEEYYETYHYEIILNGFHVTRFLNPFESDSRYNNYWSIGCQWGFAMHLPAIAVQDRRYEYAETDLARTRLTGFRFEQKFMEDIYKYVIAQLLCSKWDLNGKEEYWFSFYKGKMPLAISNQGFTILSQSFVLHTKKDVLCFFGKFSDFDEIKTDQGMLKSLLNHSCGYYQNPDAIYYRDFLFEDVYVNGESLVSHSEFFPCCIYGILYEKSRYNKIKHAMDLAEYLEDPEIDSHYKVYFSAANEAEKYREEIRKYYGYLKCEVDSCNEKEYKERRGELCILRYSPGKIPKESDKNTMLNLLKKYLPAAANDGLVPFDMEERKRMYGAAFEELKDMGHPDL